MRAANVSTFRHPDIVVMVVHTQPGANKIHTMPSFQQQSTQKKHGPFWLVIFFTKKIQKTKKGVFSLFCTVFQPALMAGLLTRFFLFMALLAASVINSDSSEVTK